MKKENLLKRCLVLIAGLFILSMGIALSVKANLGTTPISSVPYVFSLGFTVSMGFLTIVMHIIFILLQILILRKDYQPIQLLQFPVALVFGFFTDLSLFIVSSKILVSNYILQWILCLLGCMFVAFGVYLQVKAKVTYIAGEGLILAISKVFHKEFGKLKVIFDCSLVSIGIISSFIMLHKLQGIREGTIVSAILVGTIVRFYNKKLKFIDVMLGEKEIKETVIPEKVGIQKKKIIITISREYGSGGHDIGKIVAGKSGIAFYDTKLIDLSAAESGLTPEYIKENEQKLSHSLLFDLYKQNYAYVDEEMPPQDTLFMVQSKVIRDIAEKESCVIVGRCADFVLKGNPNCLNVFIHADKKHRIKRIITEYGIDPDIAEKKLEETDKARINYYKHYTRKTWGMADNYDLTIDSSLFSAEKSAKLIIEAVNKRTG